jgi:hypothetical protein
MKITAPTENSKNADLKENVRHLIFWNNSLKMDLKSITTVYDRLRGDYNKTRKHIELLQRENLRLNRIIDETYGLNESLAK